MKITINKKSLNNALKVLSKVIKPGSSVPLMDHILIECDAGKVYFTACNCEDKTSLRLTTDATVVENGATTVPVKKFKEIVKSIKGNDITLESDDRNVVKISSGISYASIFGSYAANYPDKIIVEPGVDISIDSSKFKDGLLLCEHSTNRDDSRRVLTGTTLSFEDKQLSIFTSDGMRLSWYKMATAFECDEKKQLVISNSVTRLLPNILGTGAVKLEWDCTLNSCIFRGDNFELRSRLIQGQIPNFTKVIPKENKYTIKIPVGEALEKIEAARLVLHKERRGLYVLIEDNILTLFASSADYGTQVDSILVESNSCETLDFAINADFLLDLLKNIGTDVFYIHIKDSLTPMIFTGGEQDFCEVIMPLRHASIASGAPQIAREHKEEYLQYLKANNIPVKKPVVKADSKPVVKADPKPVVKADSKPVVKADPKPAVTADPKPAVTADPKAVVTADPKAVVTADPKAVVTADPKPVVKSVCGYNPEVLYRIKKNMIKAQLRKRLFSVA